MEVKETKEAIMFLEDTLYFCIGEEDDMPEYQSKYNHWIKKVISLLKQGEKYKQIVEELEDIDKLCKSIPSPIPEKYLGIQGGKIKYVVECIKQKYFPKEAKNGKNSINRSKGRRLDKKEKEKIQPKDIKKTT